jgi:pilus assembly protein TadC
MLSLTRIYLKISGIFPKRLVDATQELMTEGGFEAISARAFLGFSVFASVGIAWIAFFLAPFFTDAVWRIPLALAAAAVSAVFFYLMVVMNADTRAKKIELVLPDVLQIISANIRAGMTLENAIWSAARPEFGPIREEIKKVSADTYGGKPIEKSLRDMSKRVKSEAVRRAIKLINEGIRLGGEMARLLDEVAADLKSAQQLQREIATTTMMYTIFIVFAAVIAAPLLFSISTQYAELSEKTALQQAKSSLPKISSPGGISAPALSGLATRFTGVKPIPSEDIKLFALASIFITNLFAGLILGLIRYGKAMRGVKYAPVFIFASLAMFFVARLMVGALIVGVSA